VSNRELRVFSIAVALLVVGAACSSGGSSAKAPPGGSSTSATTDPNSTPGGSTIPATGATTSSPTSTPAAGYASIAALLLTTVPSGLALQPDRVADTGATNLAKAIQDNVAANAGEVLRHAGFVAGYQRAWAQADQARQNLVFLYRFATAAGAAEYAMNRVSELEQVNAQATMSRFPVLITGAVGLRSESSTSSFGAVMFSKGVFAVEAVATDASKSDQSLVAAALADAQRQRLP
jgi:hypothetical protein